MKKLGLLAGLGPVATADYYRRIMDGLHEAAPGLHVPEMIVYSADIGELFEMAGAELWDEMTAWLLERLGLLRQSGADFAAISAITPHIVFDRLAERSPLPLVSIIDATLAEVRSLGPRIVGLVGTAFTMRSGIFDRPLEEAGVTVVVPGAEEQLWLQEKLDTEVELGVFRQETKSGVLAMVSRLAGEQGAEAVILGCTELPLVLSRRDTEVPLIVPSELHVEAILKRWLGAEQPAR